MSWWRLRDWQEAGVWARLDQVLLERRHAAGEIDVVIAGSSILRQAQDEGTHAWFNRFRHLPVRYERRSVAFTHLAASHITLNQSKRFC